MKIGRWWISALLVIGVVRASGETIEFAEDELATESVLPKFDQPTATKKRVVPTAKRFEVDVQAGTSLADAFFTTVPIGLLAGYHFNEFSAVQVRADYYLNSVTSYKQQIIADTPGADVRLNKNPASKYSTLYREEFLSPVPLEDESLSSYGGLQFVSSVATGDGSAVAITVGI